MWIKKNCAALYRQRRRIFIPRRNNKKNKKNNSDFWGQTNYSSDASTHHIEKPSYRHECGRKHNVSFLNIGSLPWNESCVRPRSLPSIHVCMYVRVCVCVYERVCMPVCCMLMFVYCLPLLHWSLIICIVRIEINLRSFFMPINEWETFSSYNSIHNTCPHQKKTTNQMYVYT